VDVVLFFCCCCCDLCLVNLRAVNNGPLGLGPWNIIDVNIIFILFNAIIFVPVLAIGDVLGLVATLGQIVKDQTLGASVPSGLNTVDADVKVLAIGRIGKQGIGDEGTGILGILNLSRAVELDHIRALATGTVSLSRPRAGACLLAEDEAIRASDEIGLTG